ncbi:MAG: type II toxin-antitoxin system RelE/ParE family toxin [Nitriliruptoraceae bacterium]|nr:type II toxin-antitoxin system RelE/ParE family toxin [Nitriliruptoraceae bacterium]
MTARSPSPPSSRRCWRADRHARGPRHGRHPSHRQRNVTHATSSDLDALGELERDPHLGRQLPGRLTGLRSYRVGLSRIIYELRDDATVRVIAIRHRGSADGIDPR